MVLLYHHSAYSLGKKQDNRPLLHFPFAREGVCGMMSWFGTNISLETLLWLFPITFLLHDFEEIIFVEHWFKKNYTKVIERVPLPMRGTFMELSQTTAARFSIPVFMQFIVYIIATFLAVEKQIYGPFIGFNVFLGIHVFMHIGQSLWLRTYALGVGSAVFITLPYTILLFTKLITENIINISYLISNLPYGLITLFIVWFGHKMAPKEWRN